MLIADMPSSFYKKLPGCDDAEYVRIAALSQTLSAANVPTPAGYADLGSHTLIFPYLQGVEARTIIQTASSELECKNRLWSLLLEPLVALHNTSPTIVQIQPVDPFKNISRRITGLIDKRLDFPVTDHFGHLSEDITQSLLTGQFNVVHGDFHVGQVIIDTALMKSAVVDLDDVGLGVIEMDIANLAAHMVTSSDLKLNKLINTQEPEDVYSQFLVWANKLSTEYEALTSSQIDDRRLALFGANSLLRRALKLMENNEKLDRVHHILTSSAKLHRNQTVLERWR